MFPSGRWLSDLPGREGFPLWTCLTSVVFLLTDFFADLLASHVDIFLVTSLNVGFSISINFAKSVSSFIPVNTW